MIKTLSAVAVAALTMVGAAQANIITVVDLFNTPQADVVDITADAVAVSSEMGPVAISQVLGGYRELIINQTVHNRANSTSSIGVNSGFLNMSNSAGAASTGIIRWDGFSAVTGGAINTTGLGGIYFGNALTDSFELSVDFADGVYFFQIDAYTSATRWSTVKIEANQHLFPITSLIPLAAFLDCTNSVPPGPPLVTVTCGSGGAVDFSNLGALQATIDVDGIATNLDLSLNQVTVVPEPNAIALVGLALLGAGVASRRRKV